MKPLIPQLAPGTRIRLRQTTVWPQRRGLTGVVVAPPSDGTYPQPAKFEVVVLLDDDPFWMGAEPNRDWTCVLGRADVEVIANA